MPEKTMKSKEQTVFVYIWEYLIEERNQDDFLHYYAPQGVWATFFKDAPGYLRTELLQDADIPLRFVTIDYWRSRAEIDAFRQVHAEEFARIDTTCEAFTQTETFIGDFNLIQDQEDRR